MYSTLPIYQYLHGVCLGALSGSLIVIVMFTTGVLAKIKEKKPKWMKKVAIVCFAIMIVVMMAELAASFT